MSSLMLRLVLFITVESENKLPTLLPSVETDQSEVSWRVVSSGSGPVKVHDADDDHSSGTENICAVGILIEIMNHSDPAELLAKFNVGLRNAEVGEVVGLALISPVILKFWFKTPTSNPHALLPDGPIMPELTGLYT